MEMSRSSFIQRIIIISIIMLQILFDFKVSKKNLQELQQGRLDHHLLQAIKYFDNKDSPKCQAQLKLISKKSPIFLTNTLKKMPKIIQTYWQIVKSSSNNNANSQSLHEKWESLTQQNIYQRPFNEIMQYYGQSNKKKLLECCERCLINFPSNDMAYYYKGKASIQSKQIQDGVILLKLGHDLNRANKKINQYLCSYYEKKKNYVSSMKYLQCLKEQEPLNKKYIDKFQQIRQIALEAIQKQISLKRVLEKQIIQSAQNKKAEDNSRISKGLIQQREIGQIRRIGSLKTKEIQFTKERENQKHNMPKNDLIRKIKLYQQRLEEQSDKEKIFDQILQEMKLILENTIQQNQAVHLVKLMKKLIEIKPYNMEISLLLVKFYISRNERKKGIQMLKKVKMIIFIDKKLQSFGNKKQLIHNYLMLLFKHFQLKQTSNEQLQDQLSQFMDVLNQGVDQLSTINKLITLKNKIILSQSKQITTIMYLADLSPSRVGEYLNQIFLREQKVYLVNSVLEFRQKITRCRMIIAFPETLPFLGQETQELKNTKLTVLVVDTKINQKQKENLIKQSRNIKYSNFRINIEVNKPFSKIFELARTEEISNYQSK